jgi:hypothetical protein
VQFELAAGEEREVELMVVAVAHGVQRLAGVSVLHASTILDTMQLVEVFVEVDS